MGFLYKVKVGKDENGGFYYTYVMWIFKYTLKWSDDDEGKRWRWVSYTSVCFSFIYLIFYIKFSMWMQVVFYYFMKWVLSL